MEDLGLNGKIAVNWNFEKCDTVDVDWIDLAEDRDGCWALIDEVKTFGLHKMREMS